MFYDVFRSLCDERNISCTRAASDIGLGNSTTTKWKQTGATPNGKTLAKIAEYFDVSVSYLLGEEEQKETPASETNLRDERRKQFIKLYDQLTPESEEAALVLLQQLRELQEKKLDSRP